jgi:glycosyltransferase involved in cell wall biosynthesis
VLNSQGLLAVMMPAYNEEQTVVLAIERVLARPEVGELIVVDDASSDNTWQILTELSAREPRIKIFHQPQNQGKGAAVRRAIKELNCQYAIVQDADLELDPDDYAALLKPLVEGRSDAVFGSRAFHVKDWGSFVQTVGNRGITLAANLMFWGRVEDMSTCYKLLPSDLWKSLPLRAMRFEIDVEVTAQLLRRGLRIINIPIRYEPRTLAQGKKIRMRDGLEVMKYLMRLRFSPNAKTAQAPPDGPAGGLE